MAEKDSVGPHLAFTSGAGFKVPLYMLTFDKEGKCTSPRHREIVLREAASGEFTDVHIYSHGWNNVFSEAERHYAEFFTRYFDIRQEARLDDAAYRPLIVGVVWPSTALVSKEEAAPHFAGAAAPADANAGAAARGEAATQLGASIQALGEELAGNDAKRLAELAWAPRLSAAESLELARLLAPVMKQHAMTGEDGAASATPEGLLQAWGDVPSERTKPGEIRPLTPEELARTPAPKHAPVDAAVQEQAGLEAASLPAFLDPREIVRKATVFLMKDRAGVVGRNGVGPLLAELLDTNTARVHLAGHSYGTKVILSALSAVEGRRPVESMLLLQPAINAYCFAASLPEGGGPGAYRTVLDKVRQPVYVTFSSQDTALSEFFHLALRRRGDVGELQSAAAASRYAALGAVGARDMKAGEYVERALALPPARYPVADTVRIVGLDGSGGAISAHGDVRNRFTSWALACLVSGRGQS